MSFLGDIRLGDTIHLKFTTVGTTGAPTTLAGTPSISVYPGSSTTQLGPATVASPAAGITPVIDFDGVTGMHHVTIVASSGNGYATATNYEVMISAGTVGGTSVVGYVVGSFSIENRSAVMPTVAARTLDVSATGEAGVDWANVGSPTTSLALTGTTIATSQVVASVSGAVGSVTGAVGSVTGNVGGSVGSVVGAVGSVTAGVNVTQISGSTAAADNLEAHALRAVSVTFAAGGTTTTAVFDLVDGATASATDDVYNGRVLIFSAPAGLKDQATSITDYVGATKTATIVAVTAAVGATAAAVMV